ncbi:MAG: DNA polymerase I [bacterium]|nr:DNA polymerase I [bacterium]
MKRLVVIDGKSIFYRGYFAMPGLSLPDGTPTGGVYGFTSLAIEIIKKLKPDYVAVAWDKSGTSINKRREVYPEYKAGRKKPPEDFFVQIPVLKDLLDVFGWPLYEIDDYEADDIMGTFARQAAEQDIETCLVTGDYDLLQMIDRKVHVYITRKGVSELIEYDEAAFRDKYGVDVEQFVDYKALMGDSSDNIPGVDKVGPVAAKKLLNQFQDLDDIYTNIDSISGGLHDKLVTGKQNAYLSQKLARIWTDVPIEIDLEAASVNSYDYAAIGQALQDLQFQSLIKKLPAEAGKVIPVETPAVAAEIVPSQEATWPESLAMDASQAALIGYSAETGNMWLSLNEGQFFQTSLAGVDRSTLRILEQSTLAAYDSKQLYHDLSKTGVDLKIESLHDINQAAFLIDSLVRDRSVSALVGTDIDEANIGQLSAALWQIYNGQIEKFKQQPLISRVARQLDFPLQYILFKMERTGIKIDSDLLKNMSQELGKDYNKLEQEMYSIVGYEFNIASPAQLSKALFETLELPTKGIKKGKTSFSTGQRELDKLRGQHPIIELIEKTRELAKLKNTYIDTLPNLVDDKQRVHTSFNQDVASTGRLSSTNPNLQNIPIRSEIGRKIRQAFVPEAGNAFVNADYSQFELRLAAILSEDSELINDFNQDIDIHTSTAAQVYGKDFDDVTKDERRAAKVINFGVLYGMSPHGLSAATGMSFGEAKEFIDHYFELRKPIRLFIDKTLQQAEDKGYVETYFGRRRPTPDVKSSTFMIRESAKRAAANMPIQGTEADLMKIAMRQIDDMLEEKQGQWGEQILQIHDSVLIECPEAVAHEVADALKQTMENIYPKLGVKLKVDVAIGKTWAEL